jgi:two-component system sensor histidine kinase/response regulator
MNTFELSFPRLRFRPVTIIGLILFPAITLSGVSSARTLQEIKATKEIRFCLAGSAHEFYQKNALALSKFLGDGIRPVFIHLKKWNDQFVNGKGMVIENGEYTPEPLASGRCDLYPNDLVEVPWREKKMAFVPLFISRNTIIINKQHRNTITQLSDLAGKTAAIMKGTSYQTWVEEQNRGRFKTNPIKMIFMPQEEAIKAAEAGKVDFGIIGADGALWAARTFAPNIHVAFPVGKTTVYGWCFRKTDKDLQKAVRHFFANQRKSPNSSLNKNWRDHTGLTLGEYILFVTSTSYPTEDGPK